MENLLKKIENLRERLNGIWQMLDIDRRASETHELKQEMNLPGFWDDQSRAVEVSKQAEEMDREIGSWESLRKDIRDLEELVAVGAEENDSSIEADANTKLDELTARLEKQEFFVMFSEKYDQNNVIVSIHAGTGGTDAQDWAEMLERMFLRFAENKGWESVALDRTSGQEAGIKSATYLIKGRWAYGNFKSENGVHRLVRISPFDAEAMRHTSFALVEVIPELKEAEEVEINEKDLRIDVYRSSGPGGQSVNTTDSAVRIVHLPTGIAISCQNERSQHQNRETAMKILKSKLYRAEEEKREAEERKIKGEVQKADWGKQIRSYVMQPYQMVKDHRTGYETQNIQAVMNGGLEEFVEAYLRHIQEKK